MRKRILSLILAAVMLLSLAPASLADAPRSQRESFMSMAVSQLGYRERFQNGTKYGTWYGLPNQPWCAMFISWCARYAGVPESVIPQFASCPTGANWFKQRGLWRTRDYTPQAGDLLFIGSGSSVDHVAIVESADENTVYTIEGNSTNEMVERRERKRDGSILGYATPQYGSIEGSGSEITLAKLHAPWYELRGEEYSIGGTLSSDSPITWVYLEIRNGAGEFFSYKITQPNSGFVDLWTYNDRISFSGLGPGNYELYIEAVTADYGRLQESYAFTVAATDVDFEGRHCDYAEGISWIIAQSISNGRSGALFDPDGVCTRAQVVTFLWRAVGRPMPKCETNWFYDVHSGSYCERAVQWAVENGVTQGVSRGYFAPDRTVTRAEFVTLLWRCLGSPEPTCDNPFEDIREGSFCCKAVLWAYENGITCGFDDTHFAPDANASRAQVAAFLFRSFSVANF